jgi:hypothetical protein
LPEAWGLVSLFVSAAFCGVSFCLVSAFNGVSGPRVSTVGAIEDVDVGVGVLMHVHGAVGVLEHMQVADGDGEPKHVLQPYIPCIPCIR